MSVQNGPLKPRLIRVIAAPLVAVLAGLGATGVAGTTLLGVGTIAGWTISSYPREILDPTFIVRSGDRLGTTCAWHVFLHKNANEEAVEQTQVARNYQTCQEVVVTGHVKR